MCGKPVKSSNAKIMSFPTETRVIMRFPVMPVIHWAVGDTLESRVHEKISSGGDLLSSLWRTALGEKDDAGLPGVEAGKQNLLLWSGFSVLTDLTPTGKNSPCSLSPRITYEISRSVFYLIRHPNATQGSCRQKGPCFQSLPPGHLLHLSVMPPKHTLLQNFLQIYQSAEKNQFVFPGFASREYLTVHGGGK